MNHTNGGWARKYSAAISFAVVGALLVTGCSSVPKDPASSPPATVPTVSSEPTGTVPPPTTGVAVYKPATDQGPAENVPVPVLPETAKEFSKEGLIAFTEYWYSTLGYAFETGDAKPMMEISGPDCPTCKAMKEATEAGHADGKWISGGRMNLGTPNTSFKLTLQSDYQATVMARQDQVRYYEADSKLSKELGAGVAQLDILVGVFQEGRWLALTVEHVAGSEGS